MILYIYFFDNKIIIIFGVTYAIFGLKWQHWLFGQQKPQHGNPGAITPVEPSICSVLAIVLFIAYAVADISDRAPGKYMFCITYNNVYRVRVSQN